jgi:hypothetical protein
MICKLKVIMYLVMAALLVAASGGSNKSDAALGYYRANGAEGLADDLTIGKVGNTIFGRKDT